ncbi:MAG: phosphatidate cytidylyltransferase, partial [Sulfobacillus sp.]|nr:phosphatidate cytidylyltransferase [Sulfobacillus sp.]
RLTFGFFVVIWITDAMAFFMGRKFGRRKLLPHVSPGKTWVGTLSGFFSAMVAGMLLSGWLSLGEWQGALFGAVISVSGQIGDLLESQFKRYAGVKDSGGLLPGHGGFLDRFDSVLLALPLAYYFLRSLGIS